MLYSGYIFFFLGKTSRDILDTTQQSTTQDGVWGMKAENVVQPCLNRFLKLSSTAYHSMLAAHVYLLHV